MRVPSTTRMNIIMPCYDIYGMLHVKGTRCGWLEGCSLGRHFGLYRMKACCCGGMVAEKKKTLQYGRSCSKQKQIDSCGLIHGV